MSRCNMPSKFSGENTDVFTLKKIFSRTSKPISVKLNFAYMCLCAKY
jgi:hypothetical protein